MACIANVIRNSVQYGNLGILEDGYGINMLPLATFALDTYAEDDCKCFELKEKNQVSDRENDMVMKMHKAIVIIKFKLEGQIAQAREDFGLQDRCLLHLIDYEKGTIVLEGKEYELLDKSFPTINPADPYALTEEEADVMRRLRNSFLHCEKL